MTCTLNAHRLQFLVTPEQLAWINSQTTQYRKKSDVIRDLIDTVRQGLTGGLERAYCVGAAARNTDTCNSISRNTSTTCSFAGCSSF